MSRKRKYCSAQPYLDYIGVSERERREWNKEKEDFECSICNRKIENIPENRVELIIGKNKIIPETWGICYDCRQLKPKKEIKNVLRI